MARSYQTHHTIGSEHPFRVCGRKELRFMKIFFVFKYISKYCSLTAYLSFPCSWRALRTLSSGEMYLRLGMV
jgi:hypothetical protein